MSKPITFVLIYLFILAMMIPPVYAQYDRLLYHVPLTSDSPNDIGEITSTGGSYTASGWTPSESTGQLRVDLDYFLPFEGMMEVTLKGLMPNVTDEWVPIALYSRGDGSFHDVDPSPGAYTFLKSDNHYEENGLDFKFWSAAFYGANAATERKDTPIYDRSWDYNKEYVFRIIWDRETIKIQLFDEVLAEHPFEGQVESFGYIFLGRDDTYPTTMSGVYYKDLKIYVSDTNYPFRDIANAYGEMAHRQVGGQGVAISDIDNNDEQDLYISTFYTNGYDLPNLLYAQNNNVFQEEAAARNVNDQAFTYQSLYGDFDSDGDNDLFVVNYHSSSYPSQPNHLYLNTGNGTFVDNSSNISGNTASDSKSATMLDIENDGDLDVVVINNSDAHQVYVNDGSARFNVQTRGLENFRSPSSSFQGVASGDMNKDGYQDLVLVHSNGMYVIRNDGNGYFTNATTLSVSNKANSPTLMDMDNDGDLDIFVGQAEGTRVEVFRNDGNNSYSNVSSQAALSLQTFGVLPGDWNNDGFVDLFAIDKNSTGKLFINDGSGRFSEKQGTGVEAQFADGRGAVTFDVNDDGRLDIYATSRGGYAVDDDTREEKPYNRNFLFRNEIASGRNYLKVKILNDYDQVVGWGNKVYVYRGGSLDNPSGLLGYREIVSSSGFNSQSSLIQHFGVGSESTVDVKIVLPDGSGKNYTGVPTNQTMIVRPVQVVPDRLVSDFDDSQPAIAGQVYPLAYKVLSAEQEPVPDYPVTFEILAGNGSLDPNSSLSIKTVNTDQNGRAIVDWILGPVAGIDGQNQIKVTATYEGADLQGSPDFHDVIAQAGEPSVLEKVSGDNQPGFTGEPLPNPLVVRVTDENGNPVSGHPVEFTIASGGGTVKNGGSASTQVTTNTDSDGNARAYWTLGDVLGEQSVYVRSSHNGTPLQNSPLTFTATAEKPLRKLSYVSGDRQTASVNTELAEPFVVRLLDSDNNPVVSEPVTFKATSFDASFSGQDSVSINTDNQGYARATATLGSTVGDTIYVFEAHADDASGSPVVFKASGAAGAPSQLLYVSGNNQPGTAGNVLPEPLRVRVLDSADNPVKHYDVQFSVTEGGGSFNGLQAAIYQTDNQGYANAYWRLGDKVGSNAAIASVSGFDAPPVSFTAQGVVGPPARLTKNGGDNQKGEAGQPLGQYFVVSVTDSFYNAVSNHPVTFRVTQGAGSINGRTEVTEYTNAFGQAQVLYTMGSSSYEQKVQALAERNGTPLLDSPQTFTAYLGPGDPTTLGYISGNNQIGRVNEELPDPFVVQVQDDNGVGVPDIQVEFVTFTPGASFSGATSVKKTTDQDGFARATATLGSTYGTNNYVFEAIAKYNNKNLKQSPMQFYASGRKSMATTMRKVNGSDVYTGIVGQTLADSVQVLVLDANGQAVDRHPVMFQVQEGVAFLDGQHTNLTVDSDHRGIASVSVKLGNTPGTAVIRATSDDGVNPLTPAFLDFQTQAEVGPPDAAASDLQADTDVLADGQQKSIVEITLRDKYANPIANENVVLQTAGIDVFINQPNQPTDETGFTSGSLVSANVGEVTVYALVNNQPVKSTIVTFIPGDPAYATPLNNGQSHEKGKPLPKKIGVQVMDAWNHPVPNVQVSFSVTQGGGSIAEPQPMLTDSLGWARASWTLGDVIGEQKVSASIEGLAPLEFVAYATAPGSGVVRIVSGDSLIGQVNQPLDEAFKVSVLDSSGAPITNIPVEFRVVEGQGSWLTTNEINTDQNGMAMVLLKAGAQPGLHRVQANAYNYGSVFFTFYIQETPTVTLTKQTEDGEQVRPRQELPISVQVTDVFNRPVPDERITFVSSQGQGYIKESLPQTTDDNGTVQVTWVVGISGPQQMEVKAVDAENNPTFFTAFVINSAPYFDPPLQRNRSVEAGNTLQFTVHAVDDDGDDITYIARDLPENATFDADTTGYFSWTPTMADAGEHTITFLAMDAYGAADSADVKITVDVRNMPPEIITYSPQDTVMMVQFGSQITFEILATDANSDPLSYRWVVRTSNGEALAGDSNVLPMIFTKQEFPDSFAIVQAFVSDGYAETASTPWYVHMRKVTAVELSHFQAVAQSNAVELTWNTAREEGTAGFYVLRSRHKEGPFEPLNSTLLHPQSGGEYRYVDEDVEAGDRFYYRIRELDIYGVTEDHGLVEVEIALPHEIALAQNYPNPFNPTTTIRFELPAMHHVQITIFNTNGQQVRTLVNGEFSAGIHNVVWDATNDHGLNVPSGIYYYRMTTNYVQHTRKLLLLK